MQLTNLTWPQVQALDKSTPIVFPLAALEQHGPHMPLFTDSLLCGEIIRRAARELEREVLFAPLQWLGNSDHHLDFPGTLSAPPRVYLDLLNGLIDNFVRHGFQRIVFINGHGGNDVPGKQAIFEARQRYRDRKDLLLLFATYWNLGTEANRRDPSLKQTQMGHACEWETSMILQLAPHLVHQHQSVQEVPFGSAFEPASRGWIMPDRSEPGHIGQPAEATAAKGEALLSYFTECVVNLLKRVIAWDGRSWN